MNGQNTVREATNGRGPIMVVNREQDGFRVYAANNPRAAEYVGGTPEEPTCTCAEFRSEANEWGVRCAHIEAVYGPMEQQPAGPPHAPDAHGKPPRAAATGNGQGQAPETPVQLVLKRSVSPDGRIDSLSVEVQQTVELGRHDDALRQATDTITLEDRIIGYFLQRSQPEGNGNAASGHSGNGHARNGYRPSGNGYSRPTAASGNGAAPVPAELTHIGGMQTRYGWRWYINVRVNGQEVRLFGNKTQLANYLHDAGYQAQNFPIANDSQLRMPCRVVLGQKPDSKYLTVEQVLPSVDVHAPVTARRH